MPVRPMEIYDDDDQFGHSREKQDWTQPGSLDREP